MNHFDRVNGFETFQIQLLQLMREANVKGLLVKLEELNQTAEQAGLPEVCLRAQALQDLLSRVSAGSSWPGKHILAVMDGLLLLLAHSDWKPRESLGSESFSPESANSIWENLPTHDTALK